MINTSTEFVINAIVNIVCCAGIVWSCICRLKGETSRKYKKVRAKYTVLLTGAAVMGLQPALIGSMPSRADALMSFVVFVYLLLSMQQWGVDKDEDRA